MRKSMALVLALLLLLPGCKQTGEHPVTGYASAGYGSYDRAAAGLVDAWDLPGAALAVVDDGEIVLERGYGLADIEQGEPVQPDSLFRIASVSKPVTAVAILKLVEKGRLNLDTKVFHLLDTLEPPSGHPVDLRIYRITFRHLLEHSGGWDASETYDPMFKPQRASSGLGVPEPAGCETIVRYMLGQPLDFDPGTRYAYSNLGYCVLGLAIEAVTGETYEDYVIREILTPSGAGAMHLGRTQAPERYPGEVRYYDDPAAPRVESVFPETTESVSAPHGGFHLEAMAAHGGWIASVTDLARFAAALDRSDATELLSPETVLLMTARPAPPLWDGQSSYYALGWRVRPEGSGATWWHTGAMPGTTAVLYRRHDGLIWAVLTNTCPDVGGDQFLVDVITKMGQAALLAQVSRSLPSVLVIAGGISAIATLVLKRRRRRPRL